MLHVQFPMLLEECFVSPDWCHVLCALEHASGARQPVHILEMSVLGEVLVVKEWSLPGAFSVPSSFRSRSGELSGREVRSVEGQRYVSWLI